MLCLDRVQPAVAIQALCGAEPVQRDPFCPFERRICDPAGSAIRSDLQEVRPEKWKLHF